MICNISERGYKLNSDFFQTWRAASKPYLIMADEFVGHGTKGKSKPRTVETERVCHPERLNQRPRR
jgi:hypothetical protein